MLKKMSVRKDKNDAFMKQQMQGIRFPSVFADDSDAMSQGR